MTDNLCYKEEFENTGHSYGFFLIKPSSEKGTSSEITCAIPLTKAEYEVELEEVRSIMSISAFADIVTDFNESFAAVIASMETIDSQDPQVIRKAQRALESYVESIVRTVTHFENKIKDVAGKTDSEYFSEKVSEIYDKGDSYSLLYKLRNVCQHERALPLKLNRGINPEGFSESKLILDGARLLNEHTSCYLKEKVRHYLSANPEVDIYLHSVIVFEQLSNLFNSYVRDHLLNEKRALSCSRQLEHFFSLEESAHVLFLTDMSKKEGGSGAINMTQTRIPLEYLCKLLSTHLKGRPGLLLSYWGQGIKGNTRDYLPGAYNLIGPAHFDGVRIVDIQGRKYSLLNKTLSFGGDLAEMTSMFCAINGEKLSKEQTDTYWLLYEALVKGLKMLSETPPDASQAKLAE